MRVFLITWFLFCVLITVYGTSCAGTRSSSPLPDPPISQQLGLKETEGCSPPTEYETRRKQRKQLVERAKALAEKKKKRQAEKKQAEKKLEKMMDNLE